MSVPVDLVPVERSDARTVVTYGVQLGLLTAAAVIIFVKGGELIGPGAADLFRMAVVFSAGTLIAFLPGVRVAARTGDGVAGAALLGLIGTVAFTVADIAFLRVINLYPWTWDAVGGGSGWWYLPVWWILGTVVAWMGAVVVAGEARRGDLGLGRLAIAALLGTAGLTGIGWVVTPLAPGPVLVGGAFVVWLVVWAVFNLARRSA